MLPSFHGMPATATKPASATVTSTSVTSGALLHVSSDTMSEADGSEPIQDVFPLYEQWKATLPEADCQWVSKALFSGSETNPVFELDRLDCLWWHPPEPELRVTQRPRRADNYFASDLFVWMPVTLWRCTLHCPNAECIKLTPKPQLSHCGVSPTVRQVLDLDRYYSMAGEDLECGACKGKVISWNPALLAQLDFARRQQFRVIMTSHLACDLRVIRLLRQRGQGNGPVRLMRTLQEQHDEAWLTKALFLLTHIQPFCSSAALGNPLPPLEPPAMVPVPGSKWLQSVYCLDVLQQLPDLKAAITSTFGTILKMDSTKKVVKKLTGQLAGTAAWMTSVGNERGQVLNSVLTTHEGQGLERMLTGLIERYAKPDPRVPPPQLLYVDRDCCSQKLKGSFQPAWPGLTIRLDIWHFMCRIASGVTTTYHPLFKSFMGSLSQAIFMWDKKDLDRLKEAKKKVMLAKGIRHPTEADVIRAITRKEMELHCKRATRGVEETTRLISALLEAYAGPQGRNMLGVPLLDRSQMEGIWEEQKQHVPCLQDPPGISLYTKTGTMTKGGKKLVTYRCARGCSSLESFHLHLNRFIPGDSAGPVIYQVYLLEGLVRWNQDRAEAAQPSSKESWCYNGLLRMEVNKLATAVLGHDICPSFDLPLDYTGELIGVDYLLQQGDDQGFDEEELEVDLRTVALTRKSLRWT